MKSTISILIASAALLGGILLTQHLSNTHIVHAQSGCDASSISGGYGYTLTGYVYDSQGNLYFLASAGRLVSDGAGNLTGADTYSFDGTIVRRTYTGTYSLNSDCTGSMVLQTTVGNSNSTTHGDIVGVSNAREINFVQTDPNYVFSGVLKRQNQ